MCGALWPRSGDAVARTPGQALAAPGDFAPSDIAYLDNGSQHVLPLATRKAGEAYLAIRSVDPSARSSSDGDADPRVKFARLVNVQPHEIAFVQSTTAAEQMVLRALGLPQVGTHVVTDMLHFFGSLLLYDEMERRGCEVTRLVPVDGRIRMENIEQAIREGTRLVALSLVSTINGFEHDLKAVCDLAHARGALVYADIIHAAGCMPLDLAASGVDFAACASYKWLMGDFGLGFLYVRKAVLEQLPQVNFGYYGLQSLTTHLHPLGPADEHWATYEFQPNATGFFSMGTIAHGAATQVDASLDYILRLGVGNIQAHEQDLVARLKEELPRRGYPLLTPAESRSPIVAAIAPDALQKLAAPMAAAKVKLTLDENRFRLTPSVQNHHGDLDRFFDALPPG